jgi:hypothetical protein
VEESRNDQLRVSLRDAGAMRPKRRTSRTTKVRDMGSARDVVVVVQKGDHSLGYYDFHTGEELARVPVDPSLPA